MSAKKKSRRVREPIQVYLDRRERAVLDRLARDWDVSRAEVLRRGLASLVRGPQGRDDDPMDEIVGAFDAGEVTDLSVRHDDYLAADIEDEWHGREPASS